jgi:hypothetical protein
MNDVSLKQRLLYGNFDYNDDTSILMEYDKILDIWTNDFVPEGDRYLTADIALEGADKFVIMV